MSVDSVVDVVESGVDVVVVVDDDDVDEDEDDVVLEDESSSVVVVTSSPSVVVVVLLGLVVVVLRGRSSAGSGGMVVGVGAAGSPHGCTGSPPTSPSRSTWAAGIHTTAAWSSGDRSSTHTLASSRPTTAMRSARPRAMRAVPPGQSKASARESRTVAGSGSATGSTRPERSSATPTPNPPATATTRVATAAIRPRT